MKKLVFLLAIVAASATFAVQGCGDARWGVAKDSALEQLDEMLGTMDVRRKEIDQQVAVIKQTATGLSKARTKASIKLEEIGRKVEPLQSKQADIETTLTKYRGYLAENEPVELAGQTLTPAKLKSNAEILIAAHEQTSEGIAGLENSRAQLQKIVTGFERKERKLNAQLNSLQGKISQIDSQIVAVRSLRDAREAMGNGGASLSDDVAKLEGKVNDLLADIQVELITEGQMFDGAAATKEIDSVEAIISDVQGPKGTLGAIDDILGHDK